MKRFILRILETTFEKKHFVLKFMNKKVITFFFLFFFFFFVTKNIFSELNFFYLGFEALLSFFSDD